MKLSSAVTAAVAVLSSISTTFGHSVRRNPLSRVDVLDEIVLHTAEKIQSESSFDVTFRLRQTGAAVRLSLEPNRKLLHQDLHITQLRADGSTETITTVDRSDLTVFQGHAYRQRSIDDLEWLHAGWARITLFREGSQRSSPSSQQKRRVTALPNAILKRRNQNAPVFQGAFELHGELYHVQTAASYRQVRHPQDPSLDHLFPDISDDTLVAWKDTDIVPVDSNPHSHSHSKHELRDLSTQRVASTGDKCGIDLLPNQGQVGSVGLGTMGSLGRRQSDQSLVDTIGSTDGCFSTKRIAPIGIVTDCSYSAYYESTDDVVKHVLESVNLASNLFEKTFNIAFSVQNITISPPECPENAEKTTAPWNVDCERQKMEIFERLNLFSAWKGTLADQSQAFYTLLTGCPSTDGPVGIAWKSGACKKGAQVQRDGQSTTAATNVIVRSDLEWQTLAHEIGHTFGAVHDCTSDACAGNDDSSDDSSNSGESTSNSGNCCPLSGRTCSANGTFIMDPASGANRKTFSPCSIGNICSAIGEKIVDVSCLLDEGSASASLTAASSTCGNGLVEEGEECDCGNDEACLASQCCDIQTCRFKPKAVCDPANDACCTDACQYQSKGVVCRASLGSCDLPEVCSGESGACPADVHRDDGTSCSSKMGLKSGKGETCASGVCTSRLLQCQVAFAARDERAVAPCSDDECRVSCRLASNDANTCTSLTQNFLDGTPCQSGGHCLDGRCVSAEGALQASTASEDNFFQKHKVVIIASASGGLAFLILVLGAICVCRKRSTGGGGGDQKKPLNKEAGASQEKLIPDTVTQVAALPGMGGPPPGVGPGGVGGAAAAPGATRFLPGQQMRPQQLPVAQFQRTHNPNFGMPSSRYPVTSNATTKSQPSYNPNFTNSTGNPYNFRMNPGPQNPNAPQNPAAPRPYATQNQGPNQGKNQGQTQSDSHRSDESMGIPVSLVPGGSARAAPPPRRGSDSSQSDSGLDSASDLDNASDSGTDRQQYGRQPYDRQPYDRQPYDRQPHHGNDPRPFYYPGGSDRSDGSDWESDSDLESPPHDRRRHQQDQERRLREHRQYYERRQHYERRFG